MLANENISSSERISALEKRVQQNNDEIVCLRSALADVIRRLQQVESGSNQTSSSSNNSHKNIVLSAKPPQIKTRSQELKSLNVSSSSFDSALPMSSSASSTFQKENKPPKLEQSRSKDLVSSAGSSKSTTKSTKTVNASVEYSQNSLVFNKDAGFVKFFIRGRPVTIYLPISLQISAELNDIGFQFDAEAKLKAPKETLKLEWVYGYRGKDCRSNLYTLPTGEIIYFMAAVVVLHNVEEGTQRHYLGHTDDVKSLTVHPDKVTIASGQMTGHSADARPHVRIWDSVNLNTLKIIGLNSNEFQNSICCLSFSKVDGGAMLCCVDDASERWLSVWNWQNGTKIASTKCYGDLVFQADFHPTEKNLIVSCGKQHIFFWQLDAACLTKKSGIFDAAAHGLSQKLEKPKYVLTLAFGLNGEIISGDSEGTILFWNPKDSKITRVIKDAHEGGVFSISMISSESGAVMITGGKDGKIIEWNAEYQKGRIMQLPEVNGSCRVIAPSNSNLQFIIGTTKNCIFQANFELNYIKSIVNSHFEELWVKFLLFFITKLEYA
jgi:microtubule-associated protein-like 1/2